METKQKQPNKNGTLPENPLSAMQQLIRISQQLLVLAEKETQALLFKDMLAFSILQYEKEKLTSDYTKTSEDFRNRIEEFRSLDKAIIHRLERLQRELGDKAADNNALVAQIYQSAQEKAGEGLAKASEYSRSKAVRFTKTNPRTEGTTT